MYPDAVSFIRDIVCGPYYVVKSVTDRPMFIILQQTITVTTLFGSRVKNRPIVPILLIYLILCSL